MSKHGSGSVKRFDGEDPDKYPGWKRWVRAHLKAKKVEEGCRGATVFTVLDGGAAKAWEDIPEDDLDEPGGEDLIFAILAYVDGETALRYFRLQFLYIIQKR